jgi:hypothetical protein
MLGDPFPIHTSIGCASCRACEYWPAQTVWGFAVVPCLDWLLFLPPPKCPGAEVFGGLVFFLFHPAPCFRPRPAVNPPLASCVHLPPPLLSCTGSHHTHQTRITTSCASTLTSPCPMCLASTWGCLCVAADCHLAQEGERERERERERHLSRPALISACAPAAAYLLEGAVGQLRSWVLPNAQGGVRGGYLGARVGYGVGIWERWLTRHHLDGSRLSPPPSPTSSRVLAPLLVACSRWMVPRVLACWAVT